MFHYLSGASVCIGERHSGFLGGYENAECTEYEINKEMHSCLHKRSNSGPVI